MEEYPFLFVLNNDATLGILWVSCHIHHSSDLIEIKGQLKQETPNDIPYYHFNQK